MADKDIDVVVPTPTTNTETVDNTFSQPLPSAPSAEQILKSFDTFEREKAPYVDSVTQTKTPPLPYSPAYEPPSYVPGKTAAQVGAEALAAYHQASGSTMLKDGTVMPPKNVHASALPPLPIYVPTYEAMPTYEALEPDDADISTAPSVDGLKQVDSLKSVAPTISQVSPKAESAELYASVSHVHQATEALKRTLASIQPAPVVRREKVTAPVVSQQVVAASKVTVPKAPVADTTKSQAELDASVQRTYRATEALRRAAENISQPTSRVSPTLKVSVAAEQPRQQPQVQPKPVSQVSRESVTAQPRPQPKLASRYVSPAPRASVVARPHRQSQVQPRPAASRFLTMAGMTPTPAPMPQRDTALFEAMQLQNMFMFRASLLLLSVGFDLTQTRRPEPSAMVVGMTVMLVITQTTLAIDSKGNFTFQQTSMGLHGHGIGRAAAHDLQAVIGKTVHDFFQNDQNHKQSQPTNPTNCRQAVEPLQQPQAIAPIKLGR